MRLVIIATCPGTFYALISGFHPEFPLRLSSFETQGCARPAPACPTIQKKSGFFPKVSQDLDKHPPEGLASKEAAAAIVACGDELQLAALERASVDEHYNSMGRREGKRESQSWLGLRQPASRQLKSSAPALA